MENMMKTMREHFPGRTVLVQQSLDMFGIKRNEDAGSGHIRSLIPISPDH